MHSEAPTRFIDPKVLSRLANLELLARAVVEGFMTGLHKSPHKGLSVDFMEYRPYMPGDDLRHVDWKLYARTDRYYIKEYEADTSTNMHLLVDVSRSMSYGESGTTKLTYGCYLAAALAYLMIKQRDAAALTLFDEDVVERLPHGSTMGHFHTLTRRLEQVDAGRRTDIGAPLHALARRHKQRGIVVLISDLLDDPDVIVDGLKHFRYRGSEVIVFHVMDPKEIDFEVGELLELEDLETGEKMMVEPEVAASVYQENLREYRDALEKGCGGLGIDYTLLTTDQPLDFALLEYLMARR